MLVLLGEFGSLWKMLVLDIIEGWLLKVTGLRLYLGLSLFAGGIILLVVNWAYILISLLSLEFISISCFFLFRMETGVSLSRFGSLFFLSLRVCEGCFGITILVMCVLQKGSDNLRLFSFLTW